MRELMQTEAHLRSLHEERLGLALPIVLLAAGGGVSVLTSLGGLLWWSGNEQQRYGFRDNGDRYEYKDPKTHSAVIKISSYAAVGGVLLISGALFLARRLRERRAIALEAAPYKRRRLELRDQLQAGLQLGAGQVVGTAKVAFWMKAHQSSLKRPRSRFHMDDEARPSRMDAPVDLQRWLRLRLLRAFLGCR